MSTNWPKPGLNHVPAYQQSAIPYVTRSITDECGAHGGGAANVVKVQFPFVTRFFTIKCPAGSTGNLRFGFTQLGVLGALGAHSTTSTNNNYFVVKKDTDTPRLELRCTELFFVGDGLASGFEIVAGLTTIPASNMSGMLTGSNGFEGVG